MILQTWGSNLLRTKMSAATVEHSLNFTIVIFFFQFIYNKTLFKSLGKCVNNFCIYKLCKSDLGIACSFENSLAANQNVRSYGQTFNHRALRICKKRIQKVLMLSSFFLRNSSSYLLSDSYNKTLFKSLHSVYVI